MVVATLGKGFVDALKEGVTKSGEKDTKAFAKALDGMQRNVSGVANLFRGPELVTSLVVRDQLSSTVFNSTTGWQVKGDGSATFRSVTISGGSLLISNGGADRIHLQSDGDAFFGSNIGAPATTSFSIFSNAQTYNSESMGAGDVLFGDNSAGKANLLWDVSAGKILVRGGTTTQGYYDTTGAATFGGGTTTLDQNGITLVSGAGGANYIKWVYSAGTVVYPGYINTAVSGVTPNRSVTGQMYFQAESSGSGTGDFLLYVANGDSTNYERLDITGSSGLLAFTNVVDTTNASAPILALRSLTTSTATTNFGASIDIDLSMASAPYYQTAGRIDVVYDDAAKTTSHVALSALSSSALAERLRLSSASSVFNEPGSDVDLRVEGDTATNLLVCDAGLDAVQIGTTTAGAIADFRAASIVLNEVGADADIRMEGDTATSLLVLDAGLEAVQIGDTTAGTIADFRPAAIVFNEASNDVDFRVEGATDANLLTLDGGLEVVSIGAAATAPDANYGKFQIASTGTIQPLSVRSDTVGYGFTVVNSAAEATNSGGVFGMRVPWTPSAAGKRMWILSGAGISTGTTYRNNAYIATFSAETWDSTHAGSYMGFFVTKLAAVASTEALRIQEDGTLKLSDAASWTANGTNTVTISNVAPAGVGTATISKWLTVTDSAGVVMYIPAFT